jgi:ankyrin repeat protein
LQAVRLLVDADASLVLKACGEHFETPLHRAAQSRETSCIAELLIKNGADVNAVTLTGETPLMLSELVGTTQLLLKAGAAVNSRCMLGSTVLHFVAASAENAGMLCCLLKAGADATATNTVGNAPAEVAVLRGLDTAALLQRAEADQRRKQTHKPAAALPEQLQLSKSSRG